MSIRSRLSLLVVVLFIAALSNSIFTFWLEKLGKEKLAWVNHTHEVIYTSEQLIGAIKDAETGQRGYLLTENMAYLEPYHRGLVAARESFSKLEYLTADNAEQQSHLIKIREQMQNKFEELDETIALVRDGQKSKSLEIVLRNDGKQFMDTIREYISVFVAKELVLLEKRNGAFMENRAEITTLIFVEIALFIGLAIVTYMFLHRSLFSPLQLLVTSAEKVKNGQRLEASDILDKDEMGRLLSAFYDMGDKVYERAKSLDQKAKHDSLTGLKNRNTVLEYIESSILKSKEAGRKTAILFMDLNSFKQINDSMGHDFGDLVLKEAAVRLSAAVRSGDTVFRLGGDEFLIILENIESVDNIISVIQNIQHEFRVPAKIKGKDINISISIGGAVSPDDSVNSSELIEFSDIAMYASKRDKNAAYKLFERGMLKRSSDTLPLKGRL